MEEEKETPIDLKQEVFKYLIHWRWFALSIFLAFITAVVYLKVTPKSYSVATKILIKDEKKGDLASQLTALPETALLKGGAANMEDEVQILQSRTLIEKTLDILPFDVKYYDDSYFVPVDLYRDSPIRVVWHTKNEEKVITLVITNIEETGFEVKVNDAPKQLGVYGSELQSSAGTFTVHRIAPTELKSIKVEVFPKAALVPAFQGRLSITPSSKTASVLELSMVGRVPSKAADFLNTLVKQYNNESIKDNNFIAENTARFISERLDLIASELGSVESKVQGYKNVNELANMEAELQVYLQNQTVFEKQVIENETNINIITSLIGHISQSKPDELVPGGMLSYDAGLESLISEINKMIMEKQRLSVSATTENTTYVELQEQIRSLKANLVSSLRRSLESLQIIKNDYKRQEANVQSKLSEVPRQEREFRAIAREQKVIESLYMFLLQKREETNISLAAKDTKAKVIDEAIVSTKPVAPRTLIILLASLIIGGIIPFVYIYIKNLLDTKIKNRFDVIEHSNVPFLGDIPTSESSGKLIEVNSRSSAAEAVRIVRTNLDFILTEQVDDACKVIFVTSTVSGEGKTFVSANIAATFSLSGKKVLLMGLDLRNPKLYEYLKVHPLGVSNYISANNSSIHDYILKVDGYTNFDVLSSGSIPPNPTEILMSKKFQQLFKELKASYDYIIVDTAPVSLVTDTLIISRYADATVYVVRANKIDKEMLRIPNELYRDKKLKNMALVLNDSDVTKGYGYGYGYGYGNEVVQKPLWKRVLGI
nr:tyrosine-protein kinase [uncultured Flavobacterium sp.]